MQNDSALKTRIHNLSDEELVGMIKKASEYQPEAIEYAQEELSSRGGLDAISDRISISQQHEEEIVKQYETKAPLPLATKPPWDPRSFIGMAIFFSFAASGILAGLNWRRLGEPQWMWPTILLSVVGFVGLVALDLLLGSESHTTGGAYLINIGLGGLQFYVQKPAYKEWVATYGKPTTKQSGWLIPIGICLGTIAVVVLIAFGPMFLQTHPAIEHFNRGVEYQQQGQLKLAIEEYTQAIDLDPQLAEAYKNRGIAYVEKGQHDQALSDLSKTIEIDASHASAYFVRGVVYVDIGEQERAVSDLKKALELGLNPEAKQRAEEILEKLEQ